MQDLEVITNDQMLDQTKRLIQGAVNIFWLEKNAQMSLQCKLGPLYRNLSVTNNKQTYNETKNAIALAMTESYEIYMSAILKSGVMITFLGLSIEGLRCFFFMQRFCPRSNFMMGCLKIAAKLTTIVGGGILCLWLLLKFTQNMWIFLHKKWKNLGIKS